jgi:hypothetical protein
VLNVRDSNLSTMTLSKEALDIKSSNRGKQRLKPGDLMN